MFKPSIGLRMVHGLIGDLRGGPRQLEYLSGSIPIFLTCRLSQEESRRCATLVARSV